MTLEGAIQFHETSSYVVFTMNSVVAGQYCLVLPKNVDGVYHMLIDLHMKNFFDAVSFGTKTKADLIAAIEEEYLNLKERLVNSILIFPMMAEESLQSAVQFQDKQKMFDEVKKIGAITSELYKKLIGIGVLKQNIDQKIIIVLKNEYDKKFVDWLQVQMPNFVDGISYEKKAVASNPFMGGNPFVQETPVVEKPATEEQKPVGSSIFDRVEPSVSSTPAVESSSATSIFDEKMPSNEMNVASSIPVGNVSTNSSDIFGNSASTNTTPSAPAVDLFGGATTTSSQPTSSVVENVSPSIEAQNVATDLGTTEAPKPVQNVDLEGTATFNAISDLSMKNENVALEGDEDNKKSNRGFANLAILLVILVGVTIMSIELGKFLYSVYGV